MTPTLLGRLQTRVFLTIFVALPVALIWQAPILMIMAMLILGFGWDLIYNWFQLRRWDGDWPPLFMMSAGIIEWLFPWAFVAGEFFMVYAIIWIISFLLQLGPLNIVFPHRRFHGGRIW